MKAYDLSGDYGTLFARLCVKFRFIWHITIILGPDLVSVRPFDFFYERQFLDRLRRFLCLLGIHVQDDVVHALGDVMNGAELLQVLCLLQIGHPQNEAGALWIHRLLSFPSIESP
jgi:hypothetical protein